MGSKLQKNVLTSKSLSNNLLDSFLLQCQCRGARTYTYNLAPLHWHWNGTKDCWVCALSWGCISRTLKACNGELSKISHRSTQCHFISLTPSHRNLFSSSTSWNTVVEDSSLAGLPCDISLKISLALAIASCCKGRRRI